ncbi:proline dehydrogenase, mitochondrial [[Candida] anglica]|uniref:Proline dehydrogenase n=1 Tax=[Candida] anglica TaxID=148631 RepID=A0ABP0EAE7_9ASCO
MYAARLARPIAIRPLSFRSFSSATVSPFIFATRTRNFHNTSKQKNTTIENVASTTTTSHMTTSSMKSSNSISPSEYLTPLKTSELVSYLCIGMCTLNKPILDLCIKVFPYVPMFLIKALVYKLYCGGETIEEVKQTGLNLSKRGINNMMISLTIEGCDGNDNIDPEFIVTETQNSVNDILIPHTISMIENSGKDINSIPPGYVALKPTGFTKNAANVLKNHATDPKFEELVANAAKICQSIYEANVEMAAKYPARTAPFVVGVIDAEKYDLQEGVYELQRRLYALFNPVNKPVSIVGTLQMYLSGSSDLLAKEEKLAMANNYRLGLKLVRGAYIHSEKQRSTVIHKTKEDTDNNYNQGISYCIESIVADANKTNGSTIGHLVVASHNADSLRLATDKLPLESVNRSNVVLGQLLGMADNITYDLIKNNGVDNIIKYVAWGPPLETKEYLLRRLEENGDAVRADNGFQLVREVSTILFKRLFRMA